MTAKVYKTTVGAFVLGGLALFVAGIVLLGGGRLFSDDLEYVLYFDGSVSGLSIGAPVVFRGVPMGSVTKISLVANTSDSNITIPVTIRIDNKSFIRASGASLSEGAQKEIIRRMVERGMRARLQLSSLITGQYRVELDFFPRTPINFRSSQPEDEIPTVPSPIDTLQRTFARLPIEQIVESMTSILDNLTEAVGNGQLKTAVESVTQAFTEARSLIANIAEGAIRQSLENAIVQVDGATRAVQGELPKALSAFSGAMDSLSRAADRLGKVSQSAEGVISRDSPMMNEIRRLLREAIDAARAIRNFTDMLERNPEALLKGRHGKR